MPGIRDGLRQGIANLVPKIFSTFLRFFAHEQPGFISRQLAVKVFILNCTHFCVKLSRLRLQPVDPLPPDEEVEWSFSDLLSVYKTHHMKALIWKNAMWMLRNVG